MITRRKFLASCIAAAVAPSVAPELESAPAGFVHLPGYERYTGRDSVIVPPLPGSGRVQRITQFRGNIIAIRDDRAFISSVDGWKEILSDFSPTTKYIPSITAEDMRQAFEKMKASPPEPHTYIMPAHHREYCEENGWKFDTDGGCGQWVLAKELA